jgi:hypothetical protein
MQFQGGGLMKTVLCCIVIIVIVVLLISCQTTQKPFQPRNAPSGFTTDEDGALVHIHSGGKFPMYISSFIRGKPHSYDHYGYDVSVGYSLYESGAAVATIYIYPSDGVDLKEHLGSIKNSIDYYHPDAHQVEEFDTTVELANGSEISGYCAIYTFKQNYHGRNRMVESQAFAFKRGNWFIAFRITYPVIENQELIREEVNLLVTSFNYVTVI